MSDAERDAVLKEVNFLTRLLRSSREHQVEKPLQPSEPPWTEIERLEFRIGLWGYDEGWPHLHDKESLLRHMALSLQQIGGPCWSLQEVYGAAHWHMGYSDLAAPSEQLGDDIYDWLDDYLDHSTDEYINPKMDPAFPFDEFNARGEVLAERWQRQLGAGWVVEYWPAEFIPDETNG